MKKAVTYLGNHYFGLCFLLHVPLRWCLPPAQPEGRQTGPLRASDFLADGQDDLPKGRAWKMQEHLLSAPAGRSAGRGDGQDASAG